VGGHSIRIPEPVYGMSVTGTVHPTRLMTNAAARAGDLLVLTKPLGTGIATTAIKRDLASAELRRRVVASMKWLNSVGADLAERRWVIAGTDVTGFGLLGHLGNIVRASDVGAEIDADQIPLFSREILRLIESDCIPGGTRTNLEAANKIVDWTNTSAALRVALADAQTSGGLLLCVPPRKLQAVRSLLIERQTPVCAVIGRITRGRARIRVSEKNGFNSGRQI
jgi:selenide,water dikinase